MGDLLLLSAALQYNSLQEHEREHTVTPFLEATNSWPVNIDNGLLNGVIFIDLTKGV